MRIGRVVLCLILLLAGGAVLAAEKPEAEVPPEVCSGIDFERATEAEFTEWAESVGGDVDFSPAMAGSAPDCPQVIPVCVGLIPIGCPPDACKKTSSCSSQDLGFSSCAITETVLFICTGGKTVHKKTCSCTATCAGAFCAPNSSELICE